MWFDVPVLAMRATAVPETLGDAGRLFDSDEAPETIAARAYELIHDPHLRESVIAAQRKRRLEFTSAKISSSLTSIIEQLKNGKRSENQVRGSEFS
jgi:glycosyltransferase involved in cell wall biosynthesis